MKKFLSITLMMVLVLLCTMSVVNAATTDKLVEYASKTFKVAGDEVKVPEKHLVTLKRYLKEYPVSEEDANKIIEEAEKAIDLMNEAKTSDVTKLTRAQKDELTGIAQRMASLAKVTLSYDATTKDLTILKDGKPYGDPINLKNDEFVQTGNNYMVYIVIATVAVIAVATVAAYRKTKANA